MVEPGEMVHMRVAYEHVGDAQQFLGRERAHIAQVKQEGTSLEHDVGVDGWITERTVD